MPEQFRKGVLVPRLDDVAAAAGVAKSTASRVMSGEATLTIREETRQRVLEAASKLGYRPDTRARALRLKRTYALGIVVPEIDNPAFGTIIRSAQKAAIARGYSLFISLADKKQMPGVRSPVLEWPYVEGLRMDEANHPLALLTFGMYGEVLPNQNGAPVRLVVPWKYGFKSAKSLVGIRFTEKQPGTAWNKAAANEYGFYSNVNPNVDHPRWSQATERRIG